MDKDRCWKNYLGKNKEWARDNFPVWRSDWVCIDSFWWNKSAGRVVLFRAFV